MPASVRGNKKGGRFNGRKRRRARTPGRRLSDQSTWAPDSFTVTREDFHTRGRITKLIETGEPFERLNVPVFSTESDRVMLCGSPDMLKEIRVMLEAHGFIEGNMSEPGSYGACILHAGRLARQRHE
ncbi:hypothetical protein MNJPNG_26850 [Cupriavidus oxalaticus]|uniref:hypothetical protein n=1 Tax=Cupriavidus oxalaticus TaxID=96344 RepID=UPI003F73DEAC